MSPAPNGAQGYHQIRVNVASLAPVCVTATGDLRRCR